MFSAIVTNGAVYSLILGLIVQTFFMIKNKQLKNINPQTYIVFAFGCSLWAFSGFLLGGSEGFAIILPNFISGFVLFANLFVLIRLKMKNNFIMHIFNVLIFALIIISFILHFTSELKSSHLTRIIIMTPAGFLTTYAFFPQIYWIIKKKDVKGIMVTPAILMAFSQVMWAIFYIFIISEFSPAAVYAPIGAVAQFTILFLIWKYRTPKTTTPMSNKLSTPKNNVGN